MGLERWLSGCQHRTQAIAAKRSEDAQATKDQLRAMAEKAGFDIRELFGKRGSPKGTGVAKYRNDCGLRGFCDPQRTMGDHVIVSGEPGRTSWLC
jgi:hypothetical protein